MHLTLLAERCDAERRVALVPVGVAKLVSCGWTVSVQSGAGLGAGYADSDYAGVGASIVDEPCAASELLVSVAPRLAEVNAGKTVVGLLDPLWESEAMVALAQAQVTAISLELIPRISRAQSMDVLSSMATVAGTEAVLLAARRLPKMLPLMMTAAGTVRPAQVLVIGAGVAGLQAIATAKRLGAVVYGYDVRPAAVEQIQSLGARAVTVKAMTKGTEDSGGYAAEQDDQFLLQLQRQLALTVQDSDIVITTAAIPGASSPLIITAAMVDSMKWGSVIVDLAAARGGNCALTKADQDVVHNGVTVLGPTNLASDSPRTASDMFSNNVVALLNELAPEGDLVLDFDNEITRGVVVTNNGEIVHPRVRALVESSEL